MVTFPVESEIQGLRQIVGNLESSFLLEEEELAAALSLLGIKDLEDLLGTTIRYYADTLNAKEITIESLENLDLKRLAYDFFRNAGLTIPHFSTTAEKEMALQVFGKLGRLLIHEILFPALIEVDPKFAYSFLSLLRRTAKSIAIAEGISKEEVLEVLMLDEIEIPLDEATPQKLLPAKKNKYILKKAEFIILDNVRDLDIERIARLLHNDYDVIEKKSSLLQLVNSGGKDFEPMKVKSSKIKFMTHLFYRMFNPYEKSHKPLITMNQGKGFWEFLQQNIIDESGNLLPQRLRKISSEINKSPSCKQLVEDVRKILIPIYKINNKKYDH